MSCSQQCVLLLIITKALHFLDTPASFNCLDTPTFHKINKIHYLIWRLKTEVLQNVTANIPSSVLHRIRQVVFNFLWDGKRKKKGFHLCNWQLIARPKKYGGWGLRNLFSFSRAMATNTLWRALMLDGLWHRVLKDKYFPYVSVARWLRTVPRLEKKDLRLGSIFLSPYTFCCIGLRGTWGRENPF
jgi:hypothetical protein